MEFIRDFILESKRPTLEIESLPYKTKDLDPALSEATLDYHYGKLAKTYAKRFNDKEGDDAFNKAGVFLHNILFQQYQSFNGSNEPSGKILEFIEKHFKTFDDFKEEFTKAAMAIQGSGWIYLAKGGKIKTITNHEIKTDILLLVDWWEHAWALDYQHDKKKYLENQWKIINWEKVNGIL